MTPGQSAWERALDEVRERADIVEVVGSHLRLKRAGRNLVALCPFHSEKTPSFSVNRERGFYHCFGCGAGGDVFSFVMRMEGLTFPEAVRALAERCGVTLPERGGTAAEAGEREGMLRANRVGAEFFAHVLWNTEEGGAARAYLERRGVSPETARAFMLGWAADRQASLAAALSRRELLEPGVKLGLLKREDAEVRDMFKSRLMFPIRDGQGRVVAFGGRVLDERLPKYINSPESQLYSKSRSLYGLYEARRAVQQADRVIVVEGYFDVIALWQAGFKETVASLGTSLTVEQLRLVRRLSENVLACFDADEAGRRASLRALEVFLAAGLLGRAVFIPDGFDPDTLVHERGAQAFAELLGSAELLVDYFLGTETAAATGPRGPVDKRAQAAERVTAMLKLVGDDFQFNLLVRKAADLLALPEEVLRGKAREAGRRGGGPRSRTPGAPREAGTERSDGLSGEAEVGLLAIAMLYPELRAEILAHDLSAAFDDQTLAGLVTDVCRSDRQQEALPAKAAEALSERQKGRLGAFMVEPLIDAPAKAKRLAADYLAALELRRKRREAEALRRTAAASDDKQAAQEALIALRRQHKRP